MHRYQAPDNKRPLFANLVTGIHPSGRYNMPFKTTTMEQQLTE